MIRFSLQRMLLSALEILCCFFSFIDLQCTHKSSIFKACIRLFDSLQVFYFSLISSDSDFVHHIICSKCCSKAIASSFIEINHLLASKSTIKEKMSRNFSRMLRCEHITLCTSLSNMRAVLFNIYKIKRN